ncbi:hypothetical protein BDW22DRAFT_491750 [Trametopsis cervina]|nr:hypothetical protein BDW22DRAFT_491750 [Trametopsis cervina]
MYKPEDSLIPDEFISALLRIDPNTGIGGWRVRRLKEMSAQNGDQAEEEVSPHSVEVFGTRSSEDKDGQLQSDDPKSAAAIKNAEVNTVPLSPDSIDGLRAEDQTLLPMRHGDTGAESTPVTKHGPMDAQSEAVVDEAICFADATAPRRTQASSTDDHTNRDEELCSPVHTLDATSHNVSCLDDIVVAGSLQAIQLENGDEGNSLASSSGRFVAVFEPSGSHAGAGTDSGSKVDLPPESARLERMHEELRDVHPTAIVYGQQVTDPGSLSISNIRGTVDTRGTRDEERVVSTAYSEPKHDVEWEGDAEGGESQYRGRESVVSREGMEEEDGAVDM